MVIVAPFPQRVGGQALLNYKDDGTVVVHKSITNVLVNAFKGMAKVCRDGVLEDEDMSQWTRGQLLGKP